MLGFAGRDPKEEGIKPLDALHYPRPFDVRLIGLRGRGTSEIGPPIPARCWDFANTVASFEQIVPQTLHISCLRKRSAHADDGNRGYCRRGLSAFHKREPTGSTREVSH